MVKGEKCLNIKRNDIKNSKEEGSPQYSVDFANKLTEKGVKDIDTIGVYNGTGTIWYNWNTGLLK